MVAALVMHFCVLRFRIPFPGYTHKKDSDAFDEVMCCAVCGMYDCV